MKATIAWLTTLAGFVVVNIAAWFTHVVWIVKALASDHGATAGQITLGILGAVIPPIGVVHGWVLWFS